MGDDDVGDDDVGDDYLDIGALFVLYMFSQQEATARMAVTGPPSPDDSRKPAEPRDDPFLERLFATMCKHIYILRGETFVDQARRWLAAFSFMAALQPRTEREWLLASDVTMKHLFAQHSLALGRAKGVRMKQRVQHGKDFIAHARTLHAAQLRYELIRAKPAA